MAGFDLILRENISYSKTKSENITLTITHVDCSSARDQLSINTSDITQEIKIIYDNQKNNKYKLRLNLI